jgi:hypothetical protein
MQMRMRDLSRSRCEGTRCCLCKAYGTSRARILSGACKESHALQRPCEEGWLMRSPSIVPQGFDVDVYVVFGRFGNLGRACREVGEEAADKETVIRNLMDGQKQRPGSHPGLQYHRRLG